MIARARLARALAVLSVTSLLGGAAPVIGGPVAAGASAPRLAGCPAFPATNVWNRRVDRLPVHPDSDALKRSIGLREPLHPDFGSYSGYGIPWNVVDATTPGVSVRFGWPDESDAGPYPIPPDPRIEGGSDRHILLVDRDTCRLYELFAAEQGPDGWQAGSGAIWDLRSNALRPKRWTSADAAGLPILPGLVRYPEVADGEIRHALRFTAPATRRAFVYPARHFASDRTDPGLPPMGLRVRLKRSVRIDGYPRQARVLLRALQRYGMILADNGSPWYVTGAPDPRWDDDALHTLHGIRGDDFEVVDTRALRNDS
ncbi:MAG TPA: hypothetical protein VJZ50_08555 [Candidatus Limnocylindrales bacterium]|nr:hypothetical protein [Candidatus Limnocylindrales bacterium]